MAGQDVGPKAAGLGDLMSLPLSDENQRILDAVSNGMLGARVWQQRKLSEARGLIALAQRASRLVIRQLDLRTDIFAVVELRDTPVPCKQLGADDIDLADGALLAIHYPEALLVGPIAGTQCVRVIQPDSVFHSNVAVGGHAPPLCLGPNVPRGFPLREIVLTTYGALTLQALSLDALDPAGVLNPEAAVWYQEHVDRVPLTAAPFLDGDVGTDAWCTPTGEDSSSLISMLGQESDSASERTADGLTEDAS